MIDFRFKLLVMEKLQYLLLLFFAFRLRIHDTCSVHSLHAIPGILGGKEKDYEKPLHLISLFSGLHFLSKAYNQTLLGFK